MSESLLQLSFPETDVALLTLDLPGKPVNILTREMLAQLDATLDALATRGGLAGLIIASAKPTNFIAGADIREFAASIEASNDEIVVMCRRGQSLFRRLSQVPFVTVAAIHGTCLGGGAELAVWCDRRVMSRDDKTEYGFPEVKLGLFPAWGGTVRTPRIIGLGNAVEMITGGESISAERAWELGLAWDVVAVDQLPAAAIRAVRAANVNEAYLADRKRWEAPASLSPTELAFLGATASAVIQQETKGNYPAPVAALEQLLETAGATVDEALDREAREMANLFGSPVNAALLNVFFLTEKAKKPNVQETGTTKKIEQVGVIGAGIMGGGIAAANVKRDLATVLVDTRSEAVEKAKQEILREAGYDKRTKQVETDRILSYSGLLKTSGEISAGAACDLVIEAVVENLDAKRKLFAELEPLLSADAILASNTSTIPISRLAETLKNPERFCGIHFFNPVRRMKLVEIIRGKQTSEATIAAAASYTRRIGKFGVVVNDGPGFLVNRLLSPYLNASLQLISEGIPIKEIDRAAVKFGMPLGPIELYDLVGLDTAFSAGRTMFEAFPDRFSASPILPALIKVGRLGRKNGLGFYNYQNKKQRAELDPAVDPILETYTKTKRKASADEITLRLFLPMLLEAVRVLEEGIVSDPRDVDIGLIYGLGFPPFRGGLLYWADKEGTARLDSLAQNTAGGADKSSTLLRELAASGRKFYARPTAPKT